MAQPFVRIITAENGIELQEIEYSNDGDLIHDVKTKQMYVIHDGKKERITYQEIIENLQSRMTQAEKNKLDKIIIDNGESKVTSEITYSLDKDGITKTATITNDFSKLGGSTQTIYHDKLQATNISDEIVDIADVYVIPDKDTFSRLILIPIYNSGAYNLTQQALLKNEQNFNYVELFKENDYRKKIDGSSFVTISQTTTKQMEPTNDQPIFDPFTVLPVNIYFQTSFDDNMKEVYQGTFNIGTLLDSQRTKQEVQGVACETLPPIEFRF